MNTEIIIKCTDPVKALKELNEIIERNSVYPERGIKLEHKLRKKLHMQDIDILQMMKEIESRLGDTENETFGRADEWKEMKTVNDVMVKVASFATSNILHMATTEEGSLMLLKMIALQEHLVSADQEISLEDDVQTLELDSLDCLQLMAKVEEAFDCPATESAFREEWNDIQKVGDFVEDIKAYALKRLATA